MKALSLLLLALLLTACTTAFQRADGTYDVPRSTEVRSPFGTNVGFVKLEHCTVKTSRLLFFSDYTNCHAQKDWVSTQSQGQGGQVVSGALVGLGFGLGSAFSGASTNLSTSATSSSISTVTKGHGHGH